MQRTLAQVILLSSTGPPLTAALAGGVSPGAGEAPPWDPKTAAGSSDSQICWVHMPSGGVQMLQLALQQISPWAQLTLPHAGPGAGSPASLTGRACPEGAAGAATGL
jgi:hypothetical protein